jgi:hypothetical protein
MPIPHSGPRGSPFTDLRNKLAPDSETAADTMLPAGTVTWTPFTESVTGLFMLRASGQVRLDGNRRCPSEDLIGHQPSSSERRGDS